MRITSKGQVTIPLDIRRKAGLLPHTEVDFEFDGRSVRIVRARQRKKESRGEALVRQMRGKATIKMSTEELLALTRGE